MAGELRSGKLVGAWRDGGRYISDDTSRQVQPFAVKMLPRDLAGRSEALNGLSARVAPVGSLKTSQHHRRMGQGAQTTAPYYVMEYMGGRTLSKQLEGADRCRLR